MPEELIVEATTKRLHSILDRWIEPRDRDLSDAELVRAVVARHHAQMHCYIPVGAEPGLIPALSRVHGLNFSADDPARDSAASPRICGQHTPASRGMRSAKWG